MDVPPKERDKRTEAGSELLSCSPAPVLGSFVNQRRSEILFWFKRSTIAQKAGWQQEQPVSSSTPPGGEPNIVPYVCFPALHPACFPVSPRLLPDVLLSSSNGNRNALPDFPFPPPSSRTSVSRQRGRRSPATQEPGFHWGTVSPVPCQPSPGSEALPFPQETGNVLLCLTAAARPRFLRDTAPF